MENAPSTIIGIDDDIDFGSSKPEGGNSQPIGTDKPIDGIRTINPLNLVQPTGPAKPRNPIDPTTGKPRRGRPARNGSATPSTEKGTTVSPDISLDLEGAIFGLHEMLAGFLHIEELELDKGEAAEGAKHIQSIGKLYNKQFNPATLVWCAFIMWCLTVYGTRSVAIYKRFTDSKPESKKGPQLVKPTDTPPQPQRPISEMAPSELWNEPPIDG